MQAAEGCVGWIGAATIILTGTIPEESGSHSVAAGSLRNFIFVWQTAPKNPNLLGGNSGETTGVNASLCGTSNGCVVVYFSNGLVSDPGSKQLINGPHPACRRARHTGCHR
jgi:hypothetical protein